MKAAAAKWCLLGKKKLLQSHPTRHRKLKAKSAKRDSRFSDLMFAHRLGKTHGISLSTFGNLTKTEKNNGL